MNKLVFYFLSYKFNIFIDSKKLRDDCKAFWKGFLEKDNRFNCLNEWNIYFVNSELIKTEIDYSKKKIYHYHNSVCELTEFNNLIREIIVKLSAMDGIVWIHCSGFNYKNKNFIVIGKKGYGKTTVLLNAIKNKAKFIGNDQLPFFKYNNSIYTYAWRPDIKIAIDYAINEKLTNDIKIEKDKKLLFLVNNSIPYKFIDSEKMSKRLGKKIILPDRHYNISVVSNKMERIDYIILLDESNEIYINDVNKLFELIKDDQETIFSYKLTDLKKYMPYWNKRIVSIQINQNAKDKNLEIIQLLDKQTNKIRCGKRIDFQVLWNYIKFLIEGENGE